MSMSCGEQWKTRLSFPDEFFRDEVREGFFVEEKMKHAWAAQLEMLMEIDRICKSNGIRYFADSGTLLGAVRHKGYIPWDDDIDIAMIRDDYRKFFAAAQRELPKNWVLRDWSNGGGSAFGRVINGTDYKTDEEHKRRFHGCPYIVGIDIFQLDYVPPVKEEEEAWYLLLKYLWSVIGNLKKIEKGENVEDIEMYLQKAEEWSGIKLNRGANLEIQIQRIMDSVAQLYQSSEAKELEMVVYDWDREERYKYSCEWYAEEIWIPFENIMIPVPKGYKEVLHVLYGEDYMVPKREAAGHEYPFYKRQDMLLGKEGEGIISNI